MDTPVPSVAQGDLLRPPDPAEAAASNLARYERWLASARGLTFPDYSALWQWSADEPEAFWGTVAEFFDVRFRTPPAGPVLSSREMPGARWFPGATLNYAEHVFRCVEGRDPEVTAAPAILFEGENGRAEEISRAALARRVRSVAAALRERGVRCGDRVVGYLPNVPETAVAFLAAASIGAIWSNCPAELSSRGVIERFAQIEPAVLFAVGTYRYGGKVHDRRPALREIVAGLPTLRHLVMIPGPDIGSPPTGDAGEPEQRSGVSVESWDRFLAAEAPADFAFEAVPFEHPLWILYSSGTTGIPKAIVHGHGGILLEHLKALSLQLDLRTGDRFLWYTSAGWMMWNLLISGLLLPGVTIVLYDGSPKYPGFHALWELVDRLGVTYFGTSAPFLTACMKEGIVPAERGAFDRLRTLGSTGAPLPPEAFAWIHAHVKREVLVGSMSGGTDVCTAFVLSCPTLPEYAGELQCLGLGARIESWNEEGKPSYGQVGELVLTAPFPSMPVFFWNDAEGERFRASYFERFPGTWRHGDWIEIGAPGVRCVIQGRSDSTLNRGGVRMGTAEFYSVVEDLPQIAEALVIDTGHLGRDGTLLLFIVLRPGCELDLPLRQAINMRLRTEVSPRHVPDAIFEVPEIPHTLNGKKLEVPVKRILAGTPLEKAVSREAVANPDALLPFVDLVLDL